MIRISDSLDSENAVASAIRTVETEKAGLAALSLALRGPLYEAFRDAVAAIGRISGRVVVTGIGKSGHVGAKIAATLASTGTPAFFVHPVEANHGDLGMIGRDDVILALSWSGETAELQGIVSYSRRFSIPLIAITSGARSTLAREADTILLLPKEQEACPHGLAPTTSTVMQLAIGDSLAVALLEARGFTATDFKTFHPGGKLGASLTHVGDIMHEGEFLPLVPLGTGMPEAVMMLAQKRYGCVGVVDDTGVLAGIVTDGDLARNLSRNLADLTVDDLMTRNPKTVKPTTLATAALGLLNQHNISALIVTDEGFRPIGIVHFHDLLRIGVA
ncbi:KpsF/GutQ family sugar-phosphate isomerase [Shinella daejeonensis]|uniref:KpsF/GutQ family sugar-phosphate isomerase n=1 Tax=Shinella daejeonensis TaxID=659017 RepID=UPI0020C7E007|nr:KpsF/GutQ family sugar-phosphate isomerase [Shinella daejeonensis]MCP8894250.1 KpsF/GutQ family sugar-phosphate isomerase [Shinella daejeonensis]